jgi:ABC-type amino acid transport substrate-binding protein
MRWTLARTEERLGKRRKHNNGERYMPPRCRLLTPKARHTTTRTIALKLALVLWILTAFACSRRSTAIERIREAGILRVAVDPAFPPFEYVNENGEIIGLDVDLAAELAQELNVDVHFVTTGYDALYDALTVDRADVIISALYPDPSRTAGFAFSRPYFDAGDVLVVSADSDVESIHDLADKTIGCVLGTTGHMAALEWAAELDPAPTLLTWDSPLTLTTALSDSVADAVVVDHVSALISTDPSAARILSPHITSQPYVVAARRDDADLIAELDQILKALSADGTLDTLIDRWMRP